MIISMSTYLDLYYAICWPWRNFVFNYMLTSDMNYVIMMLNDYLLMMMILWNVIGIKLHLNEESFDLLEKKFPLTRVVWAVWSVRRSTISLSGEWNFLRVWTFNFFSFLKKYSHFTDYYLLNKAIKKISTVNHFRTIYKTITKLLSFFSQSFPIFTPLV